jgi:hypothetical protein
MPSAPRNPHASRHAVAGRVSRAAAPSPPTVEAQCRAVVARLEEIAAPDADSGDGEQGASIDVRALDSLPDPTGWGGRAIVPWGHPQAGGELSRHVQPVRAGRAGWYLQYNSALFDTVRDAFFAARLNNPISAPWTTTRRVHGCGCLTVAETRHVAIEGTIDVDAQLELMRGTLKHIALAAPEINLGILANDLFAGQLVLAGHYLWRLEKDGFIDHAHDERQTSLMLTAEGTSVLLMLELTKPGVNEDVMSPQALADAAVDEPAGRQQEDRMRRGDLQLDIPRFLNHLEPRVPVDRAIGLPIAQQNTRRGSQSGPS